MNLIQSNMDNKLFTCGIFFDFKKAKQALSLRYKGPGKLMVFILLKWSEVV